MRSRWHVIGLTILAFGSGSFLLGEEPRSKPSIPNAAAQAKSLEEVNSVLADDYGKEPKSALARKLLHFGQGSEADVSRRYVLLLEAARASAAAGDGALLCQSVDALAEHYAGVDPMEMKTKGLEHAAKVVQKDSADSLVTFINGFTTTAIAGDNFGAAERLNNAALSVARRYKNKDLMNQARDQQKGIANLRNEYAKVSEALTKLANEPTDSEANLVAGKYYALVVGNWEKGLRMLALGNDPNLKAAATLDLTQPLEPAEQVALADRWWDLSLKATGIAAAHLRARAAYWYEKALPKIQDEFVKAKINKRLESIPTDSDLVGPGAEVLPEITNSVVPNSVLISLSP